MNKIVVRVSTLANLGLLSLIILITLGAYLQINNIVIALYLILSFSFFWINPRRFFIGLEKKHYRLWILYLMITFFSTQINRGDLKPFLSCISIFFIVNTLTKFGDSGKFVKSFRNLMLLLSILGIVSFFLKRDIFFEFLKSETPYRSIDFKAGGGISSLFEYRHYFACYLSTALYFHLTIPYRKLFVYHAIGAVFVLGILLTYTRNIIISIFLTFLMVIFSKRRFTSKKYLIFFLMLIFLLVFGGISSILFDGVVDTLVSRFSEIFTSELDFGGVRGYTLINGISYMFLKAPWLLVLGGGGGFALQWLRENPFYYWSAAIDNQYVTTFMDYGFLGFSILFALMYNVSKIIFLGFKEGSRVVFALCFFTIGVSMLFFEIFGTTSSILVLWTICLCNIENVNRR